MVHNKHRLHIEQQEQQWISSPSFSSTTYYGLILIYLLSIGPLLLLVESAQGAPPSVCQAKVWSYPEDCKSATNCTYQVMWRYKHLDDSIEFTVSSSNPDRWTGIIFSNEHNVTAADGIFAWIEENSYVMMDAHLPDFSQAISDNKQSVTNITAQLVDGVATFRFSRKRDTRDPEDISFADNATCPYFIFPVDGGTVDYKTRTIISNEHHPFISDKRVCVRPCDSQPPTPKPATSSTSPRPSATKPPRTTTTTTTTSTTTTTTTTPRPTTQKPTTPRTTATTTSTTTTTTPRPQTTPRSTTTTTSTTTTLPPTTITSTTSTPSTTTTSTTTTTPQPQVPTSSTTSAPKTTSTSTTTTIITSTTSISATPTTTPQPQVFAGAESNQVLQSAQSQQQQQQQWCAGRWSFPLNCRFRAPAPADVVDYLQAPIDSSLEIRPLPIELSDCAYFAQWKFHEQSDSIEFIVQTKTRHRWTGIGFSNSTKMANSDAIIGIIEEHSGRHFIMDTWLRDHVMPEIDQMQNIKQTSGRRENGTTTVRFWRSRITNDLYDFQFTDSSCAYFFFPTQGGPFNAISKRLHKHEVVPSVSQHKICVRACSAKSGGGGGGNSLLPSQSTNKQTGVDSTGEALNNVNQSTATTASSSQPANASAAEDSSSSSSSSTAVPPAVVGSSSTPASSSSSTTPAEKNRHSESTSPSDASSPNDLSADLDGTPSSPSTALNGGGSGNQLVPVGSGGFTNPFSRLAFLSEPSLRWLAGIGCVAILLAMIVFQACFTIYKNKQAYKQNLYRQSAFKQNAYLHNAYLHGGVGAGQHVDTVNYSSSGGGSTNTQSSNTATALTSAGGGPVAPGAGGHHQHHLGQPVKRSHVVAAATAASALNPMCAQPVPHHHHHHHNHRRLPPRGVLADERKLHDEEDEETLGGEEEEEEEQDMLDEEQEDLVDDYVEGDDGMMGQSDDMMEDYSDDPDDAFDYPEGHYAHGAAAGARQLIHQGHHHRPYHAHHHHQHATGHPHHGHHHHPTAANYQQRHYARGMVATAASPGGGHHHHHHPQAATAAGMTSSLIRQNPSRPGAGSAGAHYRSAGHLVGEPPHMHAHGGHHHRAQQQQQPPHSHRSQLAGQPAAHHHHNGGVHPAQRPDSYFLPSQRRYGRELD